MDESGKFGSYSNEALPATSTSILFTKKYIISAICVFILLFFMVVLFLIVGVDFFSNVDEDKSFWRGSPLKVKNGAVATDSTLCSDLGADVLENGGNAVDAAITADICLGIVHCFSTSIGGGGVMLIRTPEGEVDLLDFREVAPLAITEDFYTDPDHSSVLGPNANGVPGTLRGLYEASLRHGELGWRDLVQPLAQLASSFPVDALLGQRIGENKANILADPGMSTVFAPNGIFLTKGDTCRWPALSNTLALVADAGPDVLYGGVIGAELIADMKVAEPNMIMTLGDLQNYRPVWREPLASYYRGYKFYGAPPPYTGGAIIAQALNILEQYNIPLMGNKVQTQHYFVQALLFGYSDRTGMGDPGNQYAITNNMSDFLIPTMLSKDHAADLRSKISPDTTFPIEYYEDLVPLASIPEDHGTTHHSAMDKDGMVVATTSTINLSFGSKFMSPSTGLMMNNEMDDFSTPGESNFFGFPPSETNYPGPGLRPASSMSPTIVMKDNVPFLAIGASGGSMIPSATYMSLLNYMDLGYNLYDAINRPRLHDQWVPDTLYWEEGYTSGWKSKLRKEYGYNVSDSARSGAVVQGIAYDGTTFYAVSDRRKSGTPAGY